MRAEDQRPPLVAPLQDIIEAGWTVPSRLALRQINPPLRRESREALKIA
jgi:hypothetical protein